jgi:hypothetical protein
MPLRTCVRVCGGARLGVCVLISDLLAEKTIHRLLAFFEPAASACIGGIGGLARDKSAGQAVRPHDIRASGGA